LRGTAIVPDPLREGGLTVAIFREKTKEAIAKELDQLRVAAGATAPEPAKLEQVADFSYAPSEPLAQLIVDAWLSQEFRDQLLGDQNRRKAKEELATRGFFLANPVVISEQDYKNHYTIKDDTETVFVLPDPRRATTSEPGQHLLETARLLMAITPNGI